MIDCHCHYDYAEDPYKYIKNCEEKKEIVIGMTNLPSYFAQGFPNIQNYKYVRLALGMHPLLVKKINKHELDQFNFFISKTKFIGEVGLDFSKEGINTKEKQIEIFKYVINKCTNKIISIHSRKAIDNIYEIIKMNSKNTYIFHWYTDKISFIEKLQQLDNVYFSINPSMIKTKNGKNIINLINKDRLLTETDFPFSKYTIIGDILLYFSQIWNITVEEVDSIINKNFIKLINDVK